MTEKSERGFEDLTGDSNLILAWLRLTRSRHYSVKDWLGLQAYAPQLIAHIRILQNMLESGYEPSDAYPFYITKQDRSLRRFSFLTMDDRIVYQALCNVLIENSYDEIEALAINSKVFANIPTEPKYESPYVFKRVFSNRFSKSEGQYDRFKGQVLRSMREFLETHENAWLVRTDVRSYFPSLDHRRLCTLLESRNWLPDTRAKTLLMDCLKQWELEQGKGIPIGYECSDHIGNLFLIPLDEALAEFTGHRYVDDIYIYVEDFERAKQAIHIVDEVLNDLLLQRNTLKTEFLNLRDLKEEDLKERLTESLSQLATEKSTKKSEAERQRDLLALLYSEFETDSEKLELTGKIAGISKVAFVLYRLRREDETARRVAYHILDHHPNYAYHAMSYLYRIYRQYPEFKLKLASMFEAEYEAQDTKAIALTFLSLIDSGGDFSSHIRQLLANPDAQNWYLTYAAMRDLIYRGQAHEYSELLIRLATHSIPMLSAFAAIAVFAIAEQKVRQDLVRSMIEKQSNHVQKVGLYLAHRYQVHIDPSVVPSGLETLMHSEWLEEKDSFHEAVVDLFQNELTRDFPIEKYFGNTKQINQTLRNISLNLLQGIDDFLLAASDLVATFFRHRALVLGEIGVADGSHFPDDRDLTSLLRDLEQNNGNSRKWRNGDQDYLLGKTRKIMRHYLKKVQAKEKMIMRDEIFICYAKRNHTWRKRVRTHLKPYENYFDVTVWSDDKIRPGEDWDQEITEALMRAKVAILLMTPEFLESNYIHKKELPEIMRASQSEGLDIVWFPISVAAVEVIPLDGRMAAWDASRTILDMQDEQKSGEIDRRLYCACRDIAERVNIQVSKLAKIQDCSFETD